MGVGLIDGGGAGIDLERGWIDRLGFPDVHPVGLESGGVAGLHRDRDSDRGSVALTQDGRYGMKRREDV
jgi:hypothetical protein